MASSGASIAVAANGEGKSTPAPVAKSARYRVDAPARVVAVGDVHGDIEATRAVLSLAGAIDAQGHWSGGTLTLVQTGDQLDRGDGEREIVDLFDQLVAEAERTGGRVIPLNGNHEVMNVAGDFRYVTPGGFRAFADLAPSLPAALASRVPELQRGRAAAFLPGGEFARKLARRLVVAQVGDTVFAHGGVRLHHVERGLDRINDEAQAWMDSPGQRPPRDIMGDDALVWSRHYSLPDVDPSECQHLQKVLDRLGARRMVVGHTVQQGGITSACGDRVWRIDVGMAAHYAGREVQALEITKGGVKVLRRAR